MKISITVTFCSEDAHWAARIKELVKDGSAIIARKGQRGVDGYTNGDLHRLLDILEQVAGPVSAEFGGGGQFKQLEV